MNDRTGSNKQVNAGDRSKTLKQIQTGDWTHYGDSNVISKGQ